MLIAVAIAIAFLTNWSGLAQNFAKMDVAKQALPEVFTIALKNTIIYTVGGFVFGALLGLLLRPART